MVSLYIPYKSLYILLNNTVFSWQNRHFAIPTTPAPTKGRPSGAAHHACPGEGGAGIFTYKTGWFCGKCWCAYYSTMVRIWDCARKKAQLFFVCFLEKNGSKSSKQWVPKLVPSFCHRLTVTMFIGSAAWNFLGQGRKKNPPQPNKNVKILRARFSVRWHKHCAFWVQSLAKGFFEKKVLKKMYFSKFDWS